MSRTDSTSAPSTMVVEAADRAHLTLSVPADAVVYLSNQRMTTIGTSRQYLVPGLESGKQYRYPIRVDVVRDGQLYSANSEPRIHAGQELTLAFSQSSEQTQLVSMRD